MDALTIQWGWFGGKAVGGYDTIILDGIASAEAFGIFNLLSLSITPDNIPSAEAFGAPWLYTPGAPGVGGFGSRRRRMRTRRRGTR